MSAKAERFFEKITKTEKPIAKLRNKQAKKRSWMNKIWDKKGGITTDTTGIWRIVRDYYDLLYTNKLENFKKIGKFLDTYKLPRFNYEERKSE